MFAKFAEDKPLFSQFNAILDLEYETSQLLQVDDSDEATHQIDTASEELGPDSAIGTVSGYVPKMGLFENFEAQEGVKQIISVTLASLKMWTERSQAESWSLWLRELESFSELPLFF